MRRDTPLEQYCYNTKEDNKKHPIVYYSVTLNAVEHNYDI